jgi:hypothetical protein
MCASVLFSFCFKATKACRWLSAGRQCKGTGIGIPAYLSIQTSWQCGTRFQHERAKFNQTRIPCRSDCDDLGLQHRRATALLKRVSNLGYWLATRPVTAYLPQCGPLYGGPLVKHLAVDCLYSGDHIFFLQTSYQGLSYTWLSTLLGADRQCH